MCEGKNLFPPGTLLPQCALPVNLVGENRSCRRAHFGCTQSESIGLASRAFKTAG